MEYPQRKPNILKNFDYSQNGAYFITICVKDRHEMLGEIVGDGVLDVPKIELSDYGKITEKYIRSIDDTYTDISIDKYCIMPNHIHMIIIVSYNNIGTKRALSPTSATIPMIVSTLKRFTHREIGFNMWQRSYHDRIIRNEQEYQKIWQYIDTNPFHWQDDCFYEKETDLL